MNVALSKFNPLHYHQFDEALEAVMIEEEQQTAPRLSLAGHPVFGMLLDGVDQLNPPNDYGVKMTTPVDHVPEVTLVMRVKSIAGYFNSGVNTDHWQHLADRHPAGSFIHDELQAALDETLVRDTGAWSTVKLMALMDKLDTAGYQTAFDRAAMRFTITFREGAGVQLIDAQTDLKNKRLLDQINAVDPLENPTGGWHDPVNTFERVLTWSIQLAEPIYSPWAKIVGLTPAQRAANPNRP